MNTPSESREYSDVELLQVFGEEVARLLFQVGSFARAKQKKLFLVGGAVRDFLLGAYSDDIDFVLEEDGIGFCRELRAEWPNLFPTLPSPGKPMTFSKYGTAKLLFPSEIAAGIDSLDFATMRRERYPQPGGSPIIERGDLVSDLARRDFSVNALALEFCGARCVRLVDHFSGVEALRSRELQVLHEQSFVDDPARLIRACRFLARFSFHLGATTKILFEKAVHARYLQTLPRARLFDEFRKALCERDPSEVLSTLDEFGLLTQIHPEISFEKSCFVEAFGKSPSGSSGAAGGSCIFSKGTSDEGTGVAKDFWKQILRTLFRDVSRERYDGILGEFGVKPRDKESFLCILN